MIEAATLVIGGMAVVSLWMIVGDDINNNGTKI